MTAEESQDYVTVTVRMGRHAKELAGRFAAAEQMSIGRLIETAVWEKARRDLGDDPLPAIAAKMAALMSRPLDEPAAPERAA